MLLKVMAGKLKQLRNLPETPVDSDLPEPLASLKIPPLSQFGSRIMKRLGRAIHEFDMISEGDRVLLGLSGGKDSLTLLRLLAERQHWYPRRFTLIAAFVKSDQESSDAVQPEQMAAVAKALGVKLHQVAMSIKNTAKPMNCFWCAWNRRKVLFKLARALGCKRLALGHHRDDIIHTALMNLFYNATFVSMDPIVRMFDGEMYIIRPLAHVSEEETTAFARELGVPTHTCSCPYAQDNKRVLMREVLELVARDNRRVKFNFFNSLYGPHGLGWANAPPKSKNKS